ncbi:MAG: proline--tRNA ligase [Thermoplasmata archaeon HGW-Thermoplasmata-1]|nr:MAG: proline--tRNA ligase [Thermoplasmata archaeon HGW-Thermoplasmata-1]
MADSDSKLKSNSNVKRSEDFNEWYNQIVETADLCDKRYPVKGMNIWRPYGLKAMKNIDKLIHAEMEHTNHEEVMFPLLIPEGLFQKEADHIKGFGGEVYWVTHGGFNELDERLLLRPTSETAMYSIFPLWIRSHADLPLKTYQIVNTFRYETKMTRAFMRVREIHFFEAHTCHADFEDAEAQIKEDLDIMKSFFANLCMPYQANRRPDWDKFAGADYSIGIDCLMPSGRTLQMGSCHQYKTNFSKPYGITYEDVNGEQKFCHQTTYGMSERLLGGVIGMHSDDNGLMFPKLVAPIQVVIVPILFKGKEEPVLKACREVEAELSAAGIRVKFDERDITAGSKYYEWEQKGVCMRIEVGPRDVESGAVMTVRRDNRQKEVVKRAELVEQVNAILDAYDEVLWQCANGNLESNTHRANVIEAVEGKSGILELPWCGEEPCGLAVEERLDVSTLGIPTEEVAARIGGGEVCPVCGKPAVSWCRFARTY